MTRMLKNVVAGSGWLWLWVWSVGLAAATEPPITAVAFAPDGSSVVGCSQSGVHVYSWPDLQRLRTLETKAANLHCLAFSPNGQVLAVGGGNPAQEGTVELFSWPAGESLGVLTEHADCVLSVSWQQTTDLLTAGIDREIKRWHVDPRVANEGIAFQHTYQGHSRGVAALCLVPMPDEPILVSAGDDQSLRVWKTETAELIHTLNQHTGPVHALALRPVDGGLPMVASAAGDRTIRFWQPTIGRMVRYVRLDAVPLGIVWLGNGTQIAAACSDGRVRVVDADTVTVTQDLPALDGWAYAIAAHPTDGSLAVGGSQGRLGRVLPK